MREQFEKLPDVIIKLEHAHFVVRDGVYYPDFWDSEIDRECAEWLDGAWYAFQEQQKTIDALREATKVMTWHRDEVLKLCREYWSDYDRDYDVYIAAIEDLLK